VIRNNSKHKFAKQILTLSSVHSVIIVTPNLKPFATGVKLISKMCRLSIPQKNLNPFMEEIHRNGNASVDTSTTEIYRGPIAFNVEKIKRLRMIHQLTPQLFSSLTSGNVFPVLTSTKLTQTQLNRVIFKPLIAQCAMKKT
jgi:hypothetical protein